MLDNAAPQKAATARKAKREAGLKKYQHDWLDAPLWDQLARERGIRLPCVVGGAYAPTAR